MKKSFALALVLAALMLVTVMAVSVSADPSITLGEVAVDKDIENNLVTITVPYTAVEVDQITLLATKGGATEAPDTEEANIVYVAQQDSTVGSFTFSVYYDEFSPEEPYLWIKVGGTSIETAEAPGGEEIWVTTKLLLYGDVTNDGIISNLDVVRLTTYINTRDSESEFDPDLFPNGTFPAGEVVAELTDDGLISNLDVVRLITYINTRDSEGVLDEDLFPNGKFPSDKQ